MSKDIKVVNKYPDADIIGISVAGFRIIVERDEHGEVSVAICDDVDGGETTHILGQEGYTQRV